jgi:hypothetical protein
MSSFAASQLIPDRQRRGVAGAIADTGKNSEFADLEIAGRAAQILTLTFVGTAVADYSVEVPELGILISFTGAVSVTTSASNFVTAWNADPIARGFAVATSAAGVATLTGVGIGDDFHAISLVPSSSVMTAAETQANTEPPDYPVARAVYVDANGKATQTPSGTPADRLVGFSIYDYQSETAQGASAFAQNGARRVSFIRTGQLYVENGDSAKWRDPVYLGTDVAIPAELGKVFTAAGTGRTLLSLDRVCWGQRPNVIELSLGR